MSSLVTKPGSQLYCNDVLQAIVPLALGAAASRAAAAEYIFLAAAGHQGLLPLLHEPREWPIKARPETP